MGLTHNPQQKPHIILEEKSDEMKRYNSKSRITKNSIKQTATTEGQQTARLNFQVLQIDYGLLKMQTMKIKDRFHVQKWHSSHVMIR